MTGANICKLEKGKSGNENRKGIRVDQLCYFCDALNVTPEYLLGFTENPTEHIVSESSERSAVLEAWNAFKTEENPENQVRAIEPIYLDSPEVAAKVKFIIHSLMEYAFFAAVQLGPACGEAYCFVWVHLSDVCRVLCGKEAPAILFRA